MPAPDWYPTPYGAVPIYSFPYILEPTSCGSFWATIALLSPTFITYTSLSLRIFWNQPWISTDVIQYSSDLLRGLPVTFSPANSEEDVIRVSTELNIKFSIKETCDQSPVWKIQKSTNPEVQWFVTTGGVEGNPGKDTIANWFKIEKVNLGYKLVYCPEDICSCEVLCRDIGIYSENGKGRILSLSDALSPFLVVFKKVGSSGSSCSSI
ncbi:hypothetical protein DKX38_005727 [Salix brachista]|uniref:Uncharacterized protein n=1 Tax=Salix brachista TaxID=2182728 RepID=A0A5N5N025_9ROSI|nr:hypothetical protein DKX38_005727 [Salix brachista]